MSQLDDFVKTNKLTERKTTPVNRKNGIFTLSTPTGGSSSTPTARLKLTQEQMDQIQELEYPKNLKPLPTDSNPDPVRPYTP